MDDYSFSDANIACIPADSPVPETVDSMIGMCHWFTSRGIPVNMWKRDVCRAYRNLPIAAAHLLMMSVVWMMHGEIFISDHIGLPFGSIGAVYGWHRFSKFYTSIARRIFRLPTANFVDDFFGASAAKRKRSGGDIMDKIADLVGIRMDPEKSLDSECLMPLLGAEVQVEGATLDILVAVEESKAKKWSAGLQAIVSEQVLESHLAAKYAGRLQFATSRHTGRVGRAYIRPLHAQAMDPQFGNALSILGNRACNWFIQYLDLRPLLRVKSTKTCRNRVVTWSDAAGPSRMVAAFLWSPEQGWLFTKWKAPRSLVSRLIPRNDDQITFLELAGLILALDTFGAHLEGSAWDAYVDNQGVLGAIKKGGSKALDLNCVIGQFWIELAKRNIAMRILRVQSASNIADEPTRGSTAWADRVAATFVTPVIAPWLIDPWCAPQFPPEEFA